LADIFQLKEDVFIADLPAQVSHFTYKPDGFVYVGVGRELSEGQIQKLQGYIRENKESLKEEYTDLLDEISKIVEFVQEYKEELKQEYDELLESVRSTIETNGYFAPELNDKNNPKKAFLRNLLLLKREKTNRWMPFVSEGTHYLFNYYDPAQIRMLVPLGVVQSEGLKNIEAEQMLFFDGIRLPLPYQVFLDDFVSKLKNNGIENIVFVDFISMYPRSCRENIRVNYLLQQMAFLDSAFDPKYSLYRTFTSDAELFALLKKEDSFKHILHSFRLETLTRLALFKIIEQLKRINLDGFSVHELTNLIQEQNANITKPCRSYLKSLATGKLELETDKLEQTYGFTKAFINIQQFSFQKVMHFSNLLSEFFTHHVENERLNILWEDPGNVLNVESEFDSGALEKLMTTDCGINIRSLYCFDLECKNEHLLAPFLRNLRSVWYAAISNLFDAIALGQDNFLIEKEKYFVSPLFLKIGSDKKVYLVQKMFDEWQEDFGPKEENIEKTFNLSSLEKARWGEFGGIAYCLDWNSLGTNSGLFAFDCDIAGSKKAYFNKAITTFLVQRYQKEKKQSFVMSTTELCEKLEESSMWDYEWKDMVRQAKKNGVYKKVEEPEKKSDTKNNPYQRQAKKKIYLGTQEQIPVARMIVRLLATLEMVIKDPDADIAVRYGNRDDFKAALKLFERVSLPKYFGILFERDLFDDYDYVEPYPSWND